MKRHNPPLIVIVGPTASGKSALAVSLARELRRLPTGRQGEVISADSRQVYKGFDLGSGKITGREMRGIPHHLLDVASPHRTFSAARFRSLGIRALRNIARQGKTPIICGGTGFYIRALVDGIALPEVKPNQALRKKLSALPTERLFALLERKDPARAATIDARNPHRLIRALEIAEVFGKVPAYPPKPIPYETLFIGVRREKKELEGAIRRRFAARMKKGMLSEVKKLHAEGLSWKRLESFGLEYRALALFLQKKITKEEMEASIIRESMAYAKRQMTWFSHDSRVHWIRKPAEAIKLVRKLTSSLAHRP